MSVVLMIILGQILISNSQLMILIFVALFVAKRNKQSFLVLTIVLLFLCRLQFGVFKPSFEKEFVVISSDQQTLLLRQNFNHYKTFFENNYEIGDRLRCEGKFVFDTSPAFLDYELMNHQYSGLRIEDCQYQGQSQLIHFLAQISSHRPIFRHLIFNSRYQTESEFFSLLLSTGLLLSSILHQFRKILNLYLNEFKCRVIITMMIVWLLFIMGFKFVLFRLLIRELFGFTAITSNRKTFYEMIVCLFLYPIAYRQLAFLIVYSFRLSTFLFENTKMLKLKQLLLLIIIQLSLSYEVSLLQLFLFAGIRMLSIFVLIFDLIFKQPGISIIENIISNFEYINIKITGQMIWPLALYFCSLLVFKLKPRQLVTGIITGILVFVLMIHFNGSVRIVFVDVQQGDATLLIAPYKQSVVLIDTGRKSQYYALKKTLKKYGISKIDQLIITHADSDHNENKESLMKDFKVIEVIEDKQQKIDNPYFAFKSYLNSKNYDNENDNSLVFSINFNEASFLFLGDISKSVERDLILENPFLSASVLKLAHHGSKTSSDPYFIAQLKPDYAIISSDPKVYNHPHIEVLMTLAQYQIKTLKTYQESNIVFTYHQFFNWISTDKRFILLQ